MGQTTLYRNIFKRYTISSRRLGPLCIATYHTLWVKTMQVTYCMSKKYCPSILRDNGKYCWGLDILREKEKYAYL